MKLLIVFAIFFASVSGARILCFFYFPSISHQFVFRQIARHLSLKGHEVTSVTPNPLHDPRLVNLTEIDVSEAYKVFHKYDLSKLNSDNTDIISLFKFIAGLSEAVVRLEFANEKLQELMNKPEDSFDLILIEIHSPILFGIQHKFKAPLIAVSSLDCFAEFHHVVGNPTHPVLYPGLMTSFSKPVTSLTDKIGSVLFTTVEHLFHEFYTYPTGDAIARKYFGHDMPYLKDLVKKTSMVMLNVNPIFSDKRPNVPNVIEFFNLHTGRNDTLVEDLQKILDNAKEGVVYFSLGTNVRFDHVQGDMKKTILQALGDLPYTVLCKWEAESVEGQPKNVHLRKWLPQQAVLAHPNVKVFITQGGLQSSEEAIINAVPLVVIPFLGDQPLNAKILTSKGMAETISPKDLNRRILTETVLQVANEEKYRNRAKELRDIFLDQPQSGVEKVIWWCEYVIRHKGAKHLRSPAADIPLYEYFMLDVLAVFLLALYILYRLVKLIVGIIAGLFKKSLSTTETAKKKKKKN